ncbi:hypothetical protein IG197_19975 [Aminobacter sp. SR38]|jgi:hypothetical protein|uniref:hypothetical protein n=1 Tax=unclassified Aminobacter TaxID=2644704 RepID=UPI0012B0E925|nr:MULTISPECIES: hypothetical protein [unclassified Aminobacter]MRX37045.1 hypothetical protein [Aminobacter sp. MDW-2]QNH35022.1 hypothetical protein H5P29_03540 [Aminobacter sp. MDW-2]QOF70093.1 hypothetical protein IG197_19975 [Aminobacter sp. SR38]
MGIHLRVQRNGANIPEWGWARYAGDREFCELSLPQRQHPSAAREIKVPIFKRKEKDLVPCPICHPTEPWFRIGRMAWFPEERVVRFIGHDCAKRHYQGEFDVAEKRYRKEARIRYLQRRWSEIAPNAGRLMNAAAALSEIAKALEDVRAEIDQKARGLSKFFGAELSRNSGRIEIKIDTGVKDNQGNAVIGTDVLGTAVGTEFWGRPFVPYQQLLTLMRDIEDLSRPLPTWRGEELASQHETEILDRGASADALPDRLDDLTLLLFWSQMFFEPDNLALLERWGKNAGSPFQSLVCRFDDGRLVIASNSFFAYHYANPEVPPHALVRPPRLSSEILNLRRPMARNR